MSVKLARGIKRDVERELWGRAAARCEFRGCNKLLYKSPVTQERVHLAEKAHIWSFAEDGPRGHGDLVATPKLLNEVGNLMLVCKGCHDTLDNDKAVGRYTAALLKQWKAEHEERVRIVTEIDPARKSHVLLYGARIGDEGSRLQFRTCAESLFPEWHPADDRGIDLSMSSALDDSEEGYWAIEETNLRRKFQQRVIPMLEEADPSHVSVFALAPQPLLILLGSLLTDKVASNVYQPHRQPCTWSWQGPHNTIGFTLNRPEKLQGPPVLVISLSGKIHPQDVHDALGPEITIWELTIGECHNDFIRSPKHIEEFADTIRKALEAINAAHPGKEELAIFPAMPVSCAVELGRRRMPKGDAKWRIYDRNPKHGRFIPSLIIGENT
jgi:hypothetical protein